MDEQEMNAVEEIDFDGLWAAEERQEPETAEDGQEIQTDGADQPREEQPAQEDPAQAPGDAAKEEAAKADQPEVFVLKHLGEEKTVSREEAVALAQKGMDYDRIRTERDELRQYRQEADPALGLVRGYAERSGMSVPEYIDHCRKQELIAQGVNEQTAAAQVAVEKQQAELRAQSVEAEARQQREAEQSRQIREREEARQRDIAAFLETFPEVKADSIPKEVWEMVAKGQRLVSAYTLHQNRQLQAELAAERQNKRAAAINTGSRSTAGAESAKNIFDRAWDEAE